MHVNVQLYDDPEAVAKDAAGALDRDAQPGPFDRIDWFQLIAAHLPVKVAAIRAAAADASAWLFLADRGGGRAEALTCWYTLAFAPVFAPADHAGPSDLLLAACAKEARRHFRIVTLSPLDPDDRDRVLRAFSATGWGAVATVATVNHRVATGAGFAAWWAARPGQLRNTARRKAKAGGFRIEIADRFDPALWAAYEAVYADSWKGAEGSPALLRAMMEREGAAGALRLGIAWAGGGTDGAPVAAQIWTVENGRATIHKLAYVEAARAQSPGTVLTAAMFRHVLDRDRPDVVDFGTGDDPYKAEWMDEVRDLWRVELFRLSSPRALYRYARARAAALVAARKGR